MTCAAITTFLTASLETTKALILAYEAAVLALGTTGVQSYRLDTGQTITNVTKADIGDLNRALSGLYNRLTTLSARLNGCGVSVSVPAW